MSAIKFWDMLIGAQHFSSWKKENVTCVCRKCGNINRVMVSQSESESDLLYDWRFTANQFVLAPSPLRLTTGDFFFVTGPLWS
jgi:hypothetical protein